MVHLVGVVDWRSPSPRLRTDQPRTGPKEEVLDLRVHQPDEVLQALLASGPLDLRERLPWHQSDTMLEYHPLSLRPSSSAMFLRTEERR